MTGPRPGAGRRPAATGVSAPAGGLSSGDAPPIFFSVLPEKKTGRARSKRKGRLARSGAVALRATGIGVSVQAPLWTCLRARLGLLRVCNCRPVPDGTDLDGVQERI